MMITTLAMFQTSKDFQFSFSKTVQLQFYFNRSPTMLKSRVRPSLVLVLEPRVFNLIAGLRPELGACFIVSFAKILHKFSSCIF